MRQSKDSLIREIARMKYDGETDPDDDNDNPFVMENDDAVTTLGRIIQECRDLLDFPPKKRKPKPIVVMAVVEGGVLTQAFAPKGQSVEINVIDYDDDNENHIKGEQRRSTALIRKHRLVEIY